MENTFLLSEFLEQKVKDYQAPQWKSKAIVQGHCHHKAIMRLYDEEAVMKKMGLDFEALDSGCCGMAGSFGYEKDKYDVSIACGERKLLPKVRFAETTTLIMADGFSCKEQIEQDTPRHALHLAEVMAMAIRKDGKVSREDYPERAFVQPRIQAQKRSMWRAAILTGVAAAGFVGGFSLMRKVRR
jgi:Fe-S oxidoreductase